MRFKIEMFQIIIIPWFVILIIKIQIKPMHIMFVITINTAFNCFSFFKSWQNSFLNNVSCYLHSGQKLRTTAIPSYQLITEGSKKYQIPVNMVIQDNLKGKKVDGKMAYEKTLISITNAVLKKQDDAVYTKPYLELMSGR